MERAAKAGSFPCRGCRGGDTSATSSSVPRNRVGCLVTPCPSHASHTPGKHLPRAAPRQHIRAQLQSTTGSLLSAGSHKMKTNQLEETRAVPGTGTTAQVGSEHLQQQEAKPKQDPHQKRWRGTVTDCRCSGQGFLVLRGALPVVCGDAAGAERGAELSRQAAAAAHSLMSNYTEKPTGFILQNICY